MLIKLDEISSIGMNAHPQSLMHMGISHLINPIKWRKINHTYRVGHNHNQNQFFKYSKLGKRGVIA